jgi:CubicO group peptidase (beta-lactamase class C family)
MNMMALILGLSWVLAPTAQQGERARAREADPLRGRAQALVQPMLDKKKSVGMVVGVIEGGRTHLFGFGRVSLDGGKPPDGKTIFEIGSVTKVFTSLALAEMAEEGLVRLVDPVQRYLPEGVKVASRSGREITLEDLATHTSGLPRIPGNLIVYALTHPQDPYANYKEKDLYDFLRAWKPAPDSGSKFEYSNVGAGLLGHAISRHAGVDYGRLIANRISEPLGMRDTRVALDGEQEKRLAQPYATGGKPAARWTFHVMAGAGALHSTVDDLLVFLSAELGLKESKLRPAMEATQKPRRDVGQQGMRIGLGWIVMKLPKTDRDVIWHNGGTGGYRSFLGFVKATRTAVVVLSNSDASVDAIGFELVRLLNIQEANIRPVRSAAVDEWKHQSKRGTSAGLALDFQPTAVPFGVELRDGQPEADAPDLRRVQRLEDLAELLRGDPCARVGHLGDRHAVTILDAQGQFASIGHRLHGVGHSIFHRSARRSLPGGLHAALAG